MYGGVWDVGEPKLCRVLIPLLRGVRHVLKRRVNSLQTLTLRTIRADLVFISYISYQSLNSDHFSSES